MTGPFSIPPLGSAPVCVTCHKPIDPTHIRYLDPQRGQSHLGCEPPHMSSDSSAHHHAQVGGSDVDASTEPPTRYCGQTRVHEAHTYDAMTNGVGWSCPGATTEAKAIYRHNTGEAADPRIVSDDDVSGDGPKGYQPDGGGSKETGAPVMPEPSLAPSPDYPTPDWKVHLDLVREAAKDSADSGRFLHGGWMAEILKLCDEVERLHSVPTATPGLASVLRNHFLAAITCNHATNLDKASCGCSLVDLGWHPNVGAAVESWVQHVLGLVPSAPIDYDKLAADVVQGFTDHKNDKGRITGWEVAAIRFTLKWLSSLDSNTSDKRGDT